MTIPKRHLRIYHNSYTTSATNAQQGILHLWIKRSDLLAKLNRIGSGGKPHIGKKAE